MPVRIVSAGGGGVTLSAASTGSEFTATLPANTGTVVTTASSAAVTPAMLTQPLTLATAQTSTSGISIDFTGIPSWVRRITVMFSNVSTNGTSRLLVRVGTSGGFAITGYNAGSNAVGSANNTAGSSDTTGFNIHQNNAADSMFGSMVINLLTGTTWVSSHSTRVASGICAFGGGDVVLGGVLDRIRITTAGGTDTFDAGSINIMYEG